MLKKKGLIWQSEMFAEDPPTTLSDVINPIIIPKLTKEGDHPNMLHLGPN